jgi:hypothetical protein
MLIIVQYLCVLIAAVLLGRWYLIEARRLKATGKPWYAVYFSIPGIIILAIIIFLPLFSKLL